MIDHRTSFNVAPVEELPKHARKPKAKSSVLRLAGMVRTSRMGTETETETRKGYAPPRKYVPPLTLDNPNEGSYWKMGKTK